MTQQTLVVPARRADDFWIFWMGQIISQIGSTLTSTALPLLVFKLSGSALDLGMASAATWVPYPLFGLFIGAWIDRVNPKGLMIGRILPTRWSSWCYPAFTVRTPADLVDLSCLMRRSGGRLTVVIHLSPRRARL